MVKAHAFDEEGRLYLIHSALSTTAAASSPAVTSIRRRRRSPPAAARANLTASMLRVCKLPCFSLPTGRQNTVSTSVTVSGAAMMHAVWVLSSKPRARNLPSGLKLAA